MPPVSKDTTSVDVGSRLRQLREMREVSMRALAQKSGLSANALSMIERDKVSPSVSTLCRLADALGIPVTDFFSIEATRQQVVFLKADARAPAVFAGPMGRAGGGTVYRKAHPLYAHSGKRSQQRAGGYTSHRA